MVTKEEILNIIEEQLEKTKLLKEYFDVGDFKIELDDILENRNNVTLEDLYKLHEIIEERISEQEIIYYTEACKFLMEHDPSLTDAIDEAAELGFELKQMDSEKLATLLLQKYLREELDKMMETILGEVEVSDEEDIEDDE